MAHSVQLPVAAEKIELHSLSRQKSEQLIHQAGAIKRRVSLVLNYMSTRIMELPAIDILLSFGWPTNHLLLQLLNPTLTTFEMSL